MKTSLLTVLSLSAIALTSVGSYAGEERIEPSRTRDNRADMRSTRFKDGNMFHNEMRELRQQRQALAREMEKNEVEFKEHVSN